MELQFSTFVELIDIYFLKSYIKGKIILEKNYPLEVLNILRTFLPLIYTYILYPFDNLI